MNTNELRDCNDERLVELAKTLRRKIFDGRIKNFTNQLDDTDSLRRDRRDLARVLTVQNERARAAAEAATGTEENNDG